jgi:hypothetical protein
LPSADDVHYFNALICHDGIGEGAAARDKSYGGPGSVIGHHGTEGRTLSDLIIGAGSATIAQGNLHVAFSYVSRRLVHLVYEVVPFAHRLFE